MPANQHVHLISEALLQKDIIDLAHLYKWLVHHVRPARNRSGWVTPIQGNIGFPDLVLARGSRLIMVELKSEKGRLRPAQQEWLSALEQTHAEIYLWRPSDWVSGKIETILR